MDRPDIADWYSVIEEAGSGAQEMRTAAFYFSSFFLSFSLVPSGWTR